MRSHRRFFPGGKESPARSREAANHIVMTFEATVNCYHLSNRRANLHGVSNSTYNSRDLQERDTIHEAIPDHPHDAPDAFRCGAER
jgi:hypothetical protein